MASGDKPQQPFEKGEFNIKHSRVGAAEHSDLSENGKSGVRNSDKEPWRSRNTGHSLCREPRVPSLERADGEPPSLPSSGPLATPQGNGPLLLSRT